MKSYPRPNGTIVQIEAYFHVSEAVWVGWGGAGGGGHDLNSWKDFKHTSLEMDSCRSGKELTAVKRGW